MFMYVCTRVRAKVDDYLTSLCVIYVANFTRQTNMQRAHAIRQQSVYKQISELQRQTLTTTTTLT